MCDKFGSTNVDNDAYLVQNNEWGASDGQCVTTNAGPGFTVDAGEHHKDDSPAAYPSIMSGCWQGTCTKGTPLPQQISQLGPLSSSIAGTIPAGAKSNLAYDIWADSTPKKTGQNDAMELMIWLKETGGIAPIGSKSATVSIGGATWDVWKGTNGGVNVISYVRQGYVDSADNLPLTDFVKDAVKQGSVKDSDYLTNIQAGFEPWTGGPGLTLSKFSVTPGGTSQPASSTSPSSSAPTPTPTMTPAKGDGGGAGDGSTATTATSPTTTSGAAESSDGSTDGSGSAEPTTASAAPTATTATTSGDAGSGTDSDSTSDNGDDTAGASTTSTPTTSTASTPSSSTADTGSSSTGDSEDSSTSSAPATSTSSAPAGGEKTQNGGGGASTGAQWALTNGLAGFQSTPWNNEGAEDPVAAASPNVPGRQAVKFVVPGGGKRSESQPENSEYKAGDHKFFGYSAYLDKDFASDADSWQVIWQLHDGGTNGSPPVALEIGSGKLWLATSGNDHDKDLGAVSPGQNVAVQIEVQFQQGGGSVNVWRDGKQVLTNYTPPKGTMVDGSDYLKTGIYRDPSEGKSSTLFLNDLKIGDSLASVGGLAGQSTSSASPASSDGAAAAADSSSAPAAGGIGVGLPFLLLLLFSRRAPAGTGKHRRVTTSRPRQRLGRRIRRRLRRGPARGVRWRIGPGTGRGLGRMRAWPA